MRALGRLGLWGIAAALALAAAVWAAYSDFGAQRLASARPTAAQLLAHSIETENETRRLAEAVRALSADRERLRARIDTLERNLDEVTDSIAHMRTAAKSPASTDSIIATASPAPSPAPSAIIASAPLPALPSQPPPAPLPPPPSTSSASDPMSEAAWNAALSRPPAALLPSPAPWAPPNAHEISTGSLAARTEFGIDLGGATNIEALRTLWTSIRGKHAALLQGLRPIVVIRQDSRPGQVELRLVAGPLNDTGLAARLCNSLAAAGLACQPALFDGQRLALR